MRERSTFSLIGDRYLDTQHDEAYIGELENELARRGVVGVRRAVCEYIAAASLWWNFLALDWVGLSEKDVVVGWITNVAVFGFISFLAGYIVSHYAGFYWGLAVAVTLFLVMHVATTYAGFAARAGSRKHVG